MPNTEKNEAVEPKKDVNTNYFLDLLFSFIGVSSDGFRTTVQPAASAGASFHAAISSG